MYYLMNKDKVIASFSMTNNIGESVSNLIVMNELPYGCSEDNFYDWLYRRNAVRHRRYLNDFLSLANAYTVENFIQLTHAVSLNDTYWIKSSNEDTTWRDVSPYTSEFDEVIQNLAYDGSGAKEYVINGTSPEFGTSGNYSKCWVRESDGIHMYKCGTDVARNSGLEPYCENLASQIFVALKAGINYDLVKYRGKMASKCDLFTNEDISFVPYGVIRESSNLVSIYDYYDSLGSLDSFRRMIICDALTFNTDRHTGNHGVLFDANTNDIIRMAPAFDYNLSLFTYAERDEFTDVNELTKKYLPKIGDDFVDTTRRVINAHMSAELLNLRGFKYKFDGDDKFPKERVDWLSDITNQQIDKILGISKVKMYVSPEVEGLSNITKYKLKHRFTEDEMLIEIPRLMKAFGIQHMSELEEMIVDLL